MSNLAGVADTMYAILVKRADRLASCIEGAADIAEYLTVIAAIRAYEGARWPSGKVAGGKG